MGLRLVSVHKELHFFQTLTSPSNLTDFYEFDTNRFPIQEYLKHPRTPRRVPLVESFDTNSTCAVSFSFKTVNNYLLFPLYILLFMVDVTVPCSSARDTFHINY